jgi:hypothetical protein
MWEVGLWDRVCMMCHVQVRAYRRGGDKKLVLHLEVDTFSAAVWLGLCSVRMWPVQAKG